MWQSLPVGLLGSVMGLSRLALLAFLFLVGLATSEILSRGWARTSSPIALLMGATRVAGGPLDDTTLPVWSPRA